MAKQYILTIVFNLFIIGALFSQDIKVQWAGSVLGFSSQDNTDTLNNVQFKAKQILGIPNKLPAFGLSPCAWSPSTPDNPQGEWIQVGFSEPMIIKQVAVAENFNPGAITQIFLYDESGREYPAIYQNMNVINMTGGRMFSITMQETTYKVAAVKIMMNTQKVAGINQIDAIAISNSDQIIEAKINLPEKQEGFEISKPENLGTNVNSTYQEVSPVVSPDGRALYFTRSKHPENIGDDKKQDVWVAEIQPDSSFAMAKNMGSPVNTIHHNSSFSVSPDGNQMLLNNVYLPDGDLKKGLSITTKTSNNTWSTPQEVIIEGYYNDNTYSEFCLSADGNILLMTCQRKDSYGGKDMYVSFKTGTNTFGTPKNLGAAVNTADSETSPFLAADGKSLYFSTSGLSGYGSNDVFVSRRLDESWQNWSTPQNLGDQINTPNWDAYFSIVASGRYAYYTSYANSLGEADIFRVKLSKVNRPEPIILISGTVYNAKTRLPMSADLAYEILSTGETVGKGISNPQTGAYKIILPLGKVYGLRAEQQGFFPIDTSFDLSTAKEYIEIKKDLYLTPIEKGGEFQLNNIFFERAKSDLMPQSYPELERLAVVLKDNPLMEIELDGHTEPFGDAKVLQKLSEDRVISVRRFLVSQGIAESRIKVKGYGGTKPLTLEKTEEARASNRRVVVKVLK